jgi:hypothetical protein
MNWKKIRQEKFHASLSIHSRFVVEIDQQIAVIQLFLDRIIDAVVSWARSSEYVKSFWDEECARSKSQTSRELLKMSSLHFNNRTITFFAKKAKMLREIFFSALLLIDLIDIENSFYSTSISCSLIITERKMKKTLKQLALDKTSSSDEIFFRILRVCFKTLTIILISLFQSCIELNYHSNVFKMINTITIKKFEKDDYIVLKIYKLIILLNTLNKTLKSIMSRKIFYLTKIYRLLLDTQIRVRRDKFIELVLELLTKQMHIVWDQSNNKMITLLSMNVTKTFNTMTYRRLTHNLRKRRISQWIINWINSFLVDKRITLIILRIIID